MGVPMEGFFDRTDTVLATPTPSTAAYKAPAKTPTPSAEPVLREGTHVEGVGETTPLPVERPTPSEEAIPPAAVQTKITSSVLLFVILTSPFTAISQAAKGGASLVVTPSSIPGSATRGLDTDLSLEGSDDILEDPDDAPVLKKRISNSDEEGSASPELDFMETSEGPEIAAGMGMTAPATPVASIPAGPSAPVSAVPTTPASSVPAVFVSATLAAPIPGPLPTIPSQFEAGSSSVAVSDDAVTFLTRFDQPEVNDLGPGDFWASGSPYVDFYGFRVPEDRVSHLVMIYSSRGNFMQEFRLGRSAREHFLKMLGCVLNDIEHNFIDSVSAERILQWRAVIQELISVGFAVSLFLIIYVRLPEPFL